MRPTPAAVAPKGARGAESADRIAPVQVSLIRCDGSRRLTSATTALRPRKGAGCAQKPPAFIGHNRGQHAYLMFHSAPNYFN
jgi:hypothetical protein